MDFAGHTYPEGVDGSKYILAIIDYFSRFVLAVATLGGQGCDSGRPMEELVGDHSVCTFPGASTCFTLLPD